jgi:hypothetical protein
MASLQLHFEQFHENIKMEDENDILREKRDILIEKLKAGLKKQFKDPPIFTNFNKGGYAMNLGVKPLKGDYDIDVGLEFEINKNDYSDPVVVKKWVYDALFGHTVDGVVIKKPCVTVQYHINKEPSYHVDFAVYAGDGFSANMYLARGKPTSDESDKRWDVDDPKGTIKVIRDKFSDENDRLQFRRIIRGLKRWKDVKFLSNRHEAPIGIALTACGYWWFSVSKTLEPVKLTSAYNDLDATINLVNAMLSRFYAVQDKDGIMQYRLKVQLPVQPFNDLFAKMTDIQMTKFKKKLENFRDELVEAQSETDPHEACLILQKEYGDDFPVPDIEETAQKRKGPAIVSSSSAA